MNSLDVMFTTDRFNLSDVKDHFINPCCFGEDVAAWIKCQLQAKGWTTQEAGQEDWGWYVDAQLGDQSHTLNVGGNSNEDPANPNLGEWRIAVEKRRSIKDKLTGASPFTKDDPLFAQILEICRTRSDFKDVGVEAV